MMRETGMYIIAAAVSTTLLLTTSAMTHEDQERTHPDRDDTRVERVVDVQLPTL